MNLDLFGSRVRLGRICNVLYLTELMCYVIEVPLLLPNHRQQSLHENGLGHFSSYKQTDVASVRESSQMLVVPAAP